MQRLWKPALAALVVILLIWFFWPATRVTNLDSHNANITAGYGAQSGEDYPSRLSSITGLNIINAGVSGDTTESALARVDTAIVARDPRIVLVGLGGNDYLQGVAITTTEANLRTIIHKSQSAGEMIVLLGYRFPSLNADYEKMYKQIAGDEHCLFIPNLLRGIESNPALKSDEIHPNARGYQLIAERVAGPLKKLVRRADAAR